jgi:hypothetical protein
LNLSSPRDTGGEKSSRRARALALEIGESLRSRATETADADLALSERPTRHRSARSWKAACGTPLRAYDSVFKDRGSRGSELGGSDRSSSFQGRQGHGTASCPASRRTEAAGNRPPPV